jgi:hypothetical protein
MSSLAKPRVALEQKPEGTRGALSDAVEEALEAWLTQQGKQPPGLGT